MKVNTPRQLVPSDCYIGQTVYRVMWVESKKDEEYPVISEGEKLGSFALKEGKFVPEVWEASVLSIGARSMRFCQEWANRRKGSGHRACSWQPDVYAYPNDAIMAAYDSVKQLIVPHLGLCQGLELKEASRALSGLWELASGLRELSHRYSVEDRKDRRNNGR
jgi:hypothetical protein